MLSCLVVSVTHLEALIPLILTSLLNIIPLSSMPTQTALVDLISTAPHKHLLVLDTNIAVHQIDVLEYKCPSTSFVVILQTVLQEIQHLNVAIYRRICALLQDETKSYIFFPNEQVSLQS